MSIAKDWLKELNAEVPSTQKCLERISENTWDFKPHPTSMAMGYLALLVAEIPRWIAIMIEKNEIDFANFGHPQLKTNADLMKYFNENLTAVRGQLEKVSDEDLKKTFTLRNGDKILFQAPNSEYVGPTLNHWIHHRGQLTVYMRMKEIPVPSIYGPSADDKVYK